MSGVLEPTDLGVEQTFEAFYRREYRSVVGLAYALSGSRIGAEDLAQDAFLAAHRSWERIANYDSPEAWVRRVMVNLAVSARRRRFAEVRALLRLSARPAPSVPELPGRSSEFWSELRALPRRQAQVLALYYLEDRPVAQIAEILGVAEGTVRAHLHTGRANLARRLGMEDDR